MKSVAFGPYIGDFKFEVFYFLPYINWVKSILNPSDVYISSHFNRKFLYDGMYTQFFNVNPIFTADELGQKNHYNVNIFKNKYLTLEKEFKLLIEDIDKDILHYSFEYNRFKMPCSTFQLMYKRLNYIYRYRYSNKILFIPFVSERESVINNMYKYLKEMLGDDLIVLGDCNTYLNEHNNLLKSVNYTSNVYQEMIDAISSCKAVITPSSFWTGIANLQGKNVFSWGDSISEYRDGVHSFGNDGKYYPRLDFMKLKKCLEIYLEEKC